MIVCKDICTRLAVKANCYNMGVVYCSKCRSYFRQDLLYCMCCHGKCRSTPRHYFSPELRHTRKTEIRNGVPGRKSASYAAGRGIAQILSCLDSYMALAGKSGVSAASSIPCQTTPELSSSR